MREDPRNISIVNFSYSLPDERIAKYPLAQRDQSKLLIYDKGEISENRFSQLPSLLPQNSSLIWNNTKVIQARLEFFKETGSRIEIFCLEPAFPEDYERNLAAKGKTQWLCLIGNAKKWKKGSLQIKLTAVGLGVTLTASKLESSDKAQLVEFSWDPDYLSWSEILDTIGQTPIPPYLHRKPEQSDKTSYQTVYAKSEGSVAAPTAGLHFTQAVEESLASNNIKTIDVTLHVGAGTFTPVKSEQMSGHAMHTEHISIPYSSMVALLKALKHGITAVGTTSMRTLESLFWLGHIAHIQGPKFDASQAHHIDQWLPYQDGEFCSAHEAVSSLVKRLEEQNLDELSFTTGILIAPGYKFQIVDRLVTNFHQPGSTLLLLVAAFVGEDWHKIYQYALRNSYRFLSYGDSSLLHRKP